MDGSTLSPFSFHTLIYKGSCQHQRLRKYDEDGNITNVKEVLGGHGFVTGVHNRRHDYWSFLTKRRDHFEGWPQKKKLTQTTFALMKVSLYVYLGQLVVMLLSTVHLAFIGISMWIEAS